MKSFFSKLFNLIGLNVRQWIGVFLIIVGIIALCYGFSGTAQMSDARDKIDRSTSLIPENPAKSIVKGNLHSRVDQYELPVLLLYIGGSIAVIGGIVMIFCCRRKGDKSN